MLHGRPFPLNGTKYANVFIHYQPLDHNSDVAKFHEEQSLLHGVVQGARKLATHLQKDLSKGEANEQKKHSTDHLDHDIGGHERHNHDHETLRRHLDQIDKESDSDAANNPYVHFPCPPLATQLNSTQSLLRISPFLSFPFLSYPVLSFTLLSSPLLRHQSPAYRLRRAAAAGDFLAVEKLLRSSTTEVLQMLNSQDENEWEPLHEAARAGNLEMVKLMVNMGADIGAKNNHEETPFDIAKRWRTPGHAVIHYFESIGAP